MQTTKLNRREKRALALIQHYSRCEAMGRLLGLHEPDGKRISVALWKAERLGAKRAERLCSDEEYTRGGYGQSECDKAQVVSMVKDALGRLPAGFYVNSDPRGHALLIDSETPLRDALEALQWPKDWGGNYILSPDIE